MYIHNVIKPIDKQPFTIRNIPPVRTCAAAGVWSWKTDFTQSGSVWIFEMAWSETHGGEPGKRWKSPTPKKVPMINTDQISCHSKSQSSWVKYATPSPSTDTDGSNMLVRQIIFSNLAQVSRLQIHNSHSLWPLLAGKCLSLS